MRMKNIYLEDKQVDAIQSYAKRDKQSFAKIVRDAVDEYISYRAANYDLVRPAPRPREQRGK